MDNQKKLKNAMSNIKTIIFFFVLSFVLGCKTETAIEAKKPNILLIVIDDQGYADFSPFENHATDISTPNISRLGKFGTVFTQAYVTAPVCSPARAGILTGKNQFRWDKRAGWGPGLPEDVKTIPEYLKEAGYETARIGKNDLGINFHKNNVREYPLNHGYDEFLGFSAHSHDYWANSQNIKERANHSGIGGHIGPLMHNMGEKNYDNGYLTEIFTDESIAYIEKKREKPFFLTLSYNSVHHLIHEVPKKYLDKYNAKEIPNYDPDNLVTFENKKPGSYSAYYEKYSRVGAIKAKEFRNYYLANLNCLDDNIGRVLDALDEQNITKNTVIVFVSDNGGSPLTGANNAPLTAGKFSLWEGGIRVPMTISWAGNIEAGKVENNYVSSADILPTLVNIAGGEINDKTLDGMNLLEPDANRLLVWKWLKTWAVRQGDWKLTTANEKHGKGEPTTQYITPIVDNMELKLFNLANDPGERIDLASVHPEKVKELETAYTNWCKVNIVK